MAFSISDLGIPALRDFADASQHESWVTPIQGNGVNAGKKPLTQSRRATHMTIRRERNIMSPLGNQGMAIMCQLYRTDCVIFYEDNSVTIATDGWNTTSTKKFINAIMRRDVSVGNLPKSTERNVLYCGRPPNRKDFLWQDEVHLGVDRLPIDPEPCVVHRVNLRAMHEVRKLNAPFLRYVKSLIKVAYPMGETVEEEDYLRRLKRYAGLGVDLDNFPSSECVDTLCNIMREDNIEDWADALDACAIVSMDTVRRWPKTIHSCRPDRLLKVINDLLKYGYSDAVFREVTLPLGEVKNDPNKEYIR